MADLSAFAKGIVIPITADSSGLKTGLNQANGSLDKTSSKFSKFSSGIKKNGMAIGAGMTAAGVGIIALTDSAKKTNATLMTTGIQLGVTTDDMRDLALETTNVTFPLSEVTATFDLLTRAGMENTDQIEATATAFDTLGDATGNSASTVTSSLIPAFNAFNIPLEEAGSHTDTLTYLFRNSTIEMSGFSGAMNYLSADIDTLGISMEDTAGILLALSDKGIQGSAATREFRTAVTAATSDTTDYTAELSDLSSEMTNLKGKHDDLNDSMRDNTLSVRSNEIAIADAKDRLAEMRAEGQKEGETTEQYNRRLESQQIRIESLGNRQDDLIEKQKDINAGLKENAEAQTLNTDATTTATESAADQSAGLQTLYDELGITAEEVEGYKTKMADAEGMTQDFADAQNTQYGTMDKLKQKYEEFALSAGTTLEPLEGLGAVMAAGGPLILGMTMMPSLIGGVSTAFTLLSANPIVLVVGGLILLFILLNAKFDIVGKAADILGKGFEWLSGIVSDLIDWVSDAVDWSDVLGTAFDILLNPIDLVKIAMGKFGDAWGIVWDGILDITTKVSDFVMGIWDALTGDAEDTTGLLDTIWSWTPLGMITGNWDKISGFLSGAWDTISDTAGGALDKLGGMFGDAWTGITDTTRGFKEDTTAIMTGAVDSMMDITAPFVSKLPEDYRSMWGDIGDGAKSFISGDYTGAFSSLVSIATTYTDMVFETFDDMRQGIVDTFNKLKSSVVNIWTGIENSIKSVINGIIDGINTMIRGINRFEIDVPGWVTDITGFADFGFNIATIPRLAAGGIVTQPTVAMIGEAGPEAIVPLDGSSSGVGGVTIQVENMNVRTDNDIKLVAQELYTLSTRKNRARGIQ